MIGCAYENASNTSGVISYGPGPSTVMTALGMPPKRWVGGICGMLWICERLEPGSVCWNVLSYPGIMGVDEWGTSPLGWIPVAALLGWCC